MFPRNLKYLAAFALISGASAIQFIDGTHSVWALALVLVLIRLLLYPDLERKAGESQVELWLVCALFILLAIGLWFRFIPERFLERAVLVPLVWLGTAALLLWKFAGRKAFSSKQKTGLQFVEPGDLNYFLSAVENRLAIMLGPGPERCGNRSRCCAGPA